MAEASGPPSCKKRKDGYPYQRKVASRCLWTVAACRGSCAAHAQTNTTWPTIVGQRILRVTIVRTTGGECTFLGTYFNRRPKALQARVYLASHMALFTVDHDYFIAEGDEDDLHRAAALYDGEHIPENVLDAAARYILRPSTWRKIVAVANALMRRGTLYQADIERLCG